MAVGILIAGGGAEPVRAGSRDTFQSGRFRIHQPNYVLFGVPLPKLDTDPLKNQAKFRISVQYLVAGRVAEDKPTPAVLIAYTQTSFWNLYDPSQPLYDNHYQPEAYVRVPGPGLLAELAFGVRHHSNGLDFQESRSFQRTFLRGVRQLGGHGSAPGERRNDGYVALEASVPWDKADNPDIAETTGYGRLELYWRPARGAGWPGPGRHGALAVRIPWGGRTFFPSVEATWAFRLGDWGRGWLAPRVAVQYFEGFAQNLLDYHERSSSWRIGLVFGE